MNKHHSAHCRRCQAKNIVKHKAGSVWLESLLWLALITPGFIYHMWRHKHNYYLCHDCGNKMRILPRRRVN